MHQVRELLAERAEDQFATLPVVDIRGMDDRLEHKPNRVDKELPRGHPRSRPFDFLAAIETVRAALLGGPRALAVDDAGTRCGFRPARTRTRSRNRAWMRSHVPSMRQAR